MLNKRKPLKKAESIDISAKLAEALAEKPKLEKPHSHEAPQVGDTVCIGSGEAEYRVSYVSPSGREANLDIPGTNLERFRVPVDDLTVADQAPPQPKETAKPKIDKEDVHEHLVSARHSTMHHFEGDIATLKRYFKSKGLPASTANELDELRMDIEDRWSGAIESIMDKFGR
jgi:hypothetical protein